MIIITPPVYVYIHPHLATSLWFYKEGESEEEGNEED